jgi:hypothetical protein
MSIAAIVAVRVGSGLAVLWLAALVFAIFIVVDMARRPGWQWQRAGSSKVLWLVLEIVFILGFLSILVGILYLAVIRPKLIAAEREGQGPPGWAGGGWTAPGTPQWPGGPTWPEGGVPTSPPPVPGAYPPAGVPPAGSAGASAPGSTAEAPPAYPPTHAAGATASGDRAAAEGPPPYPGTVAESSPPFGWYPDPSHAHELRYWDGRSWTEHVSDAGTQSTDPPPG